MYTDSVVGDFGTAKLEIVPEISNTQLWHMVMDNGSEYWSMWKADAIQMVKAFTKYASVADNPKDALSCVCA